MNAREHDRDRGLRDALRRGFATPMGAGEPASDAAIARFRARAERAALVDVAYATVPSPVGDLLLAATDQGLVALGWDLDRTLATVAARVSPRVLESPRRLDGARRQLDEYFDGRRRRFAIGIDWALVRGFRLDVLRELAEVPYGEVVTYKDLAGRVGNPNASRAVGSTMANNPIAIVVPCHRVVRSGGDLGNYSGRDGVATKRFLLDLEGADLG